ncbi:MAG: 50S ribosomal protein L25 [Candidatus Hinthialibacteria bacterium OLB16]|nr:MAG: 50S ribosomal protein L25 [Candidatus Hinthialibacteria bacterium OLB16]
MQKVAITADVRRDNGKGVARKLRAQGLIPAVLYGGDGPPVSLKLVRRDLALVMQGHEGHHLLVDLAVKDDQGAGENPLVFLQELDVNPITQVIEHADFWRVDATKPIHTTVAIHLSGTRSGCAREGFISRCFGKSISKPFLWISPKRLKWKSPTWRWGRPCMCRIFPVKESRMPS